MSLQIKIVAGGQTGADRAALDFAIEHGVPHGGWCPKGRLAEDGPLADRYRLQETPSDQYEQRTEFNVRDSDGTVIFTISPALTGGSLKAAIFAQALGKPLLHLCQSNPPDLTASELSHFIQSNRIHTLNVAGSRGSEEPKVGAFARRTLAKALLNLNISHHHIRIR